MTTASRKASNAAVETGHLLEQVERHAEANPDATEYHVTTEYEAEQLLLAMAAVIQYTSKSIRHEGDKRLYLDIANKYRQAVINQGALELIRAMTEEDQLELYGLKIVAPMIVVS